MRRDLADRIVFALLSIAVILASIYAGSRKEPPEDHSLRDRALSCAIELRNPSKHLPGLTFGYNYEMLRRFASSLGDTLLPVANPRVEESWLDSLRMGRVDIVVLPFSESMSADSILFSRPLDSLTVWAVRQDFRTGLEEINDWMDDFMASEAHESVRDAFLLRYNPSKRAEWGRTVNAISPYDSLVTRAARTLGWDWRLLSALIYQESQFHIETRSRRGAEGLMQMMPATARRMGVSDLLDPEENIRAGVSYLNHLQKRLSDKAADRDELVRFTLAAYNAGEGRIMDCINYAQSVGADASTWEGILSVIPQMRDESTIQVDSILRLGTFQGTETIHYVEKVLSVFEDFKAIRP